MKPTFPIFLATALLAGCSPPPSGSQNAASAPAAGPLKTAAVRVAKKNLVRTTEQPAQIIAWETTPLYSKVAAYVERIEKDRNIGDVVIAGETLAVLRAPELIDAVNEKDALVKQAGSGVVQAQAGVTVANAAVEKAAALKAELQAGIDRATAERNRAELERKRVVELAAQGSVTNKLSEEVESKYQSAVATLAEANAKFASVAATIKEAEAQVIRARADLEAAIKNQDVAAAALKAAESTKSYLTITAPFAGIVTARNVDTGHFVAPATSDAAKPMFVVARADKLRVRIDVPEIDAKWLNAGDKATVRIATLGNKTLAEGIAIKRTSTAVDPQSGTMRAEIDLEQVPEGLRPGLYATAMIELERREGALVLPSSALFEKDGKTACVVIVDGKAVIRTVQKGLVAGTEVEILPDASAGEGSGVKEGDLVVAKNAATITADQAIEGIEPPPAK